MRSRYLSLRKHKRQGLWTSNLPSRSFKTGSAVRKLATPTYAIKNGVQGIDVENVLVQSLCKVKKHFGEDVKCVFMTNHRPGRHYFIN